MPVACEAPGAPPRQSGNRSANIAASLATDVDDPWMRLQTIAGVMNAAKTELELAGPELMCDWAEFFPPFLHETMTRYVHWRRRKFPDKPDMANVVVSNMRGPETRWSFGSALVEDIFLAGPPNIGIGSTLLLWSYADRLSFTVLSFADSMQDPLAFGGYLRESLAELVVAADSHRSEPGHVSHAPASAVPAPRSAGSYRSAVSS